jgi:hypothetical protein
MLKSFKSSWTLHGNRDAVAADAAVRVCAIRFDGLAAVDRAGATASRHGTGNSLCSYRGRNTGISASSASMSAGLVRW